MFNKMVLNPPVTELTVFFTVCRNDPFTKTPLYLEVSISITRGCKTKKSLLCIQTI